MDADGTHVAADGGGHAPHRVGIEGGAPGKRNGVGSRPPGGEAGQTLVVCESRYAEPVRGGDTHLCAGQGERAQGGVDRDCAERTGQLPQSGGQECVQVDGLLHVVLVRGHFTALIGGTHPHPVQLCGLLLDGHRVDQGVDSRGDRKAEVVPERFRQCSLQSRWRSFSFHAPQSLGQGATDERVSGWGSRRGGCAQAPAPASDGSGYRPAAGGGVSG